MSSGVVSVFERLILASTQQRKSPINATLFGISNLVFDGLKLFSKVSLEFLNVSSSFVAFSALLFGISNLDFAFGRSQNLSTLALTGIFLFVFELFELGLFVFSIISKNHFVSLALSRTAVIAALSTLTLELILFWSILNLDVVFCYQISKSLSQAGGIFLLLISTILVVFCTGKVPFDLVEAESELIDGASSDISGGVFSSFYAAEVLEFLFLIKFIEGQALGPSLFSFSVILILTFVGRIFLARFLFTETVSIFLTIGLGLGPIWILKKKDIFRYRITHFLVEIEKS